MSKTVLAEHGLSIMQFLSYTDMVNVETMILHSTGEWISETLSLPVAKHDAQSIGSTCTYARRYSWAAICGLAQEDDDANAAVGHKPEAQKQAATNKEPDYAAMLNSAKSLPDLSKIWNASIPDDQRDKYRTMANEIKLRFPKMEAVA